MCELSDAEPVLVPCPFCARDVPPTTLIQFFYAGEWIDACLFCAPADHQTQPQLPL